MRTAILAVLAAGLAATASAQTGDAPNPVIAHYRAYRAALERNDMAAAEVAAEAALAASEARDGDGGRTAVLAMNLAQARLDRGRTREALAPAQRAHGLALSRGAQSGVDPLLASLILGRAELAGDDGNEARLVAALEQAKGRSDVHTEAYAAAIALNGWAFANEEWRLAQTASVAAGRHAEGGEFGAQLARADALTTQAVALIMLERDRDAYAALTEAFELCSPLAAVRSPAGDVTVAQEHCAHTLAWSRALNARLRSGDRQEPATGTRVRVPSDYDLTFGSEERTQRSRTSASCRFGLIARPLPDYPREALRGFGVGAVVLRVTTDANGAVLDKRVLAVAPNRSGFRESVERVMGEWGIKRHEDSAPDCSMDTTFYTVIHFQIR